jgi:hypothetical protein
MSETLIRKYVISSKHPNKPNSVVVQEIEKQIDDLKRELAATGEVNEVTVQRVGTLPFGGAEAVIIKVVIALVTGAAGETGKIIVKKLDGWFTKKSPDAQVDVYQPEGDKEKGK